jgi:hypothetical protein
VSDTTLTITYGDQSPAHRDQIGDDIRGLLSRFDSPDAPFDFLCDRFTGQGYWHSTLEHSGVIVVQVPDLPATEYKAIVRGLRDIARGHGQDAIGLATAEHATLVTP